MKVLVCGGRDFADAAAVDATLSAVQERFGIDEIIHGAARGADQLGGEWAAAHGIAVREFPADWQKDGRAAGPKRNARMLVEGSPDIVIAFEGGRGTAHMRDIAQQAGIAVLGPKQEKPLELLSGGTAILEGTAAGWPGDREFGKGDHRRWPVTSDVWFRGNDEKTGQPGIVYAVMVDIEEAKRRGFGDARPPWPPIYALNPSPADLARLKDIAELVNAGVDLPDDRLFQAAAHAAPNGNRSKPINLANVHDRLQAVLEARSQGLEEVSRTNPHQQGVLPLTPAAPAQEEQFDFFWQGPLSQWHSSTFEVEGVRYSSGEQFMMAEKAKLFGDEDILAKILAAKSPKEQKALGRQVAHFDEAAWNAAAKDVVYRGNYAKFSQNPVLLEALLSTKGKTLVEASPYDTIWGIGLKAEDPRALDRTQWRGLNLLGETLTLVRDDLIRDRQIDETKSRNEFLVGRSDQGSDWRRERQSELSEGMGDAHKQEAEMATDPYIIQKADDYQQGFPANFVVLQQQGEEQRLVGAISRNTEGVHHLMAWDPEEFSADAEDVALGRGPLAEFNDRVVDPTKPLLKQLNGAARPAPERSERKADPEEILTALGRSQATFNEKDIDRALKRAVGRGGDPAPLKAALMGSENLVALPGDDDGAKRYGTMEYIRAEQDLWQAADKLAGTRKHRGNLPRLEARMKAAEAEQGWEFSAEQRGAVREMVDGPDLVILVGKAGTGKTTITRMAVEEWRASGFDVRGAALAGIAADNLREETGAESNTVAKLMSVWDKRDDAKARIEAGDKSGFHYLSKTSDLELRRNTILLTDEAGMVDVMANSRFMKRAAAAGTKVVALGDPEQLASINAGAGLRGLVERHGAVTLTKVVRQKDPEQRKASEALSVGDMKAGLGYYQDAGKIAFADTRDTAKAAMVDQYVARHLKAPERSRVLLASTNADVADLNARTRVALKEAGQLKAGVTVASEAGEVEYAPGDRILFLKNDKGLGVFNGTRGTVTGIQVEGEAEERTVDNAASVERAQAAKEGGAAPVAAAIAVKLDNGREVSFVPEEYQDHAHANATTVYKSQGQTIDEVWQLADKQMYGREQAYVGGTRHRHDYHIHVGKKDFSNFDALVAGASRSQGKDLANDFTDVMKMSVDRPAAAVEQNPVEKAADQAVAADPALVPKADIDYGEWLEHTGLDDSFVGDGQAVPGTGDLYEAAMRRREAMERKAEAGFPTHTTVIDGALVHGDGPIDEKGQEAMSALIAAARNRLKDMPAAEHSVEASIASKDDIRAEAVGYARQATVGPAIAEAGRDKRGMVRFEWPDVAKAENDRRVAIMTTPDNYPAAKQALVERFQTIDPKGFSAWEQGGRHPLPAPRVAHRQKGGSIGD